MINSWFSVHVINRWFWVKSRGLVWWKSWIIPIRLVYGRAVGGFESPPLLELKRKWIGISDTALVATKCGWRHDIGRTNPITDVLLSFYPIIPYFLWDHVWGTFLGPVHGFSRDYMWEECQPPWTQERSCLRLDPAAQRAGQEKTSQIIAPGNSPP